MDEQNQSNPPVNPAPDTGASPVSSQPQEKLPEADLSGVQTPPASPTREAVSTTSDASLPPLTTETSWTSLSQPSSEPAGPTSTSSSPPPPLASQQQHTGKRFPWIFLLILLFIGFLALATWYFTSQLRKTATPVPTSAQSAASGSSTTLVVGTDPTFQPMEYTQGGKMVGYDIDLANLLAKQLGVQMKFKNITFDNLFTALKQHQIDMIISAVTITPERQKNFTFSNEYLNAGEVIITQKTNTLIKSPQDLKGKKIGVQQGTTDESEALKYTDNNLVIRFPDYVQATKALVSGNIDAIITDLPSAQGIAGTNPTLKIASDPFTNDSYGIVFRKGDPEVEKVNKALDSLSVRGYLTELKHKWLD